MKKRNLIALGGMAAVFVAGGSLAYFNQTMQAENNFDTAKYGTTLVEDFKPSEGDDWQPGVTVNKAVVVNNTGDVPVVVRVKFDETWARGEEIKKISSADKKAGETAGNNKLESVYQADVKDGLITDDDSVVAKKLNLDNWVYNADDGYYYFKTPIQPGTNTGAILENVTLAADADMGDLEPVKYYSLVKGTPDTEAGYEWKVFPSENGKQISEAELEERVKKEKPDAEIYHFKSDVSAKDGAKGYSDANYTLTVTAQTVQLTKDAIADTFKEIKLGEDGNPTELKDCNWFTK